MNDLASVDAVLQHQVKGAAGEWLTASEGDGGALAQQLLVRPWSSSSSYDAADSGMGGQISAQFAARARLNGIDYLLDRSLQGAGDEIGARGCDCVLLLGLVRLQCPIPGDYRRLWQLAPQPPNEVARVRVAPGRRRWLSSPE